MESIPLPSAWTELLQAFNAEGVRFLIVGAHALGRYATPRATGDLDIFVERSAQNARRVYRALASFGAPLADVCAEDFEGDDLIYMFGVPPLRIDVMTDISGVSFAEAWERREPGTLGDVPVAFIGRDDFLRNKAACGRPKDLADIDAVERA